MAEITISPLGHPQFRVQVAECGEVTPHEVTVPERLGDVKLRDDAGWILSAAIPFRPAHLALAGLVSLLAPGVLQVLR